MTNPARRLQMIFARWSDAYTGHTSAHSAREWNSAPSVAMDQHLEAFRLLLAIGDSLDYLEAKNVNVNVYRAAYVEWTKIVLNNPNAWTTALGREAAFPEHPIAHLDTLATVLDLDRPVLHPEPEAKLRAVVDQVMELLGADESISPSLREYVYRLVTEIRTALDDEAVMGSFDFAEGAQRLWIALFAAAGQSTKMRSKWKAAASGIFRDAGVAALGSLPSVGLTIAQIASTAS
ncbi:hypothetical protein [Agromyces lapidis]|uniref:Uncharacterized protein n=1 Tax=Agromyces lapidis TaxID=279574 RepID=A0ABV5SSI3_9MICO|nr:hypothetical protein [Agromyces lapidis]